MMELSLAIIANCATIVAAINILERPSVPTRNVNLTSELNSFVAKKIKTGRYENASEVVRAALRTLEREERQYEARLAALRAAIDQGFSSGIASGDVFRRVRKRLKLPPSAG
jgi:antitoxin ParD1/3/4